MSGKNKHRNTKDYLNYLRGELSGSERHAFERGLEADPFEQEALEGLESLSPAQAEEDLLALHNRLRKRLARRRRFTWYGVAATVASLLIVGSVFLKIHDFNPRLEEEQVYPEKSIQDYMPEEAESLLAPEEEKQDVLADDKQLDVADQQTESRGADLAPAAETETKNETKARTELREFDLEEEVLEFALEEEPEVEIEINQMAAPVEAEEITHVEAEPVARTDEAQAARPSKEFRRSKKAQGVMISDQKQEMEQLLTGKVTGIVISAEDQGPIPGAVIVNRDVKSGVYTDLEGRFGLPVQENTNTTLVASYIGMKTQEYEVENGAHLELVMQPDATTLDEVVVVGYGAEREVQPTGSVFELYQVEDEEGAEYKVAEPSIGFKDYRTYIEDNIRYPEELGTQKKVVVLKFTVTKTGTVEQVLALRSPGGAYTEEATRLLLEGPAWNPASNEQGPRDESVRIRFVFKK